MTAMGFLGIDRSVTGRRWVGPDDASERLAEAIEQTGQSRALSQHLAGRGLSPDAVATFLDPSLRDLLPDPSTLRDMDVASTRLNAAVASRDRIAIFADYDVDGATSAALLMWWLRALGHSATIYVPDRIAEGYGPNAPAVATLAADHDLIVCVDCGTLSHDALAAAKGTDVIVLDHHLGLAELPPALAVVNPNRMDEDGALAYLCAAAVVFLCLVDANRKLRAQGGTTPDLMAMLDLVALGTVADVAPLVGVNRAFVRRGLTIMARRDRPGIRALADAARMDGPPSAYHLGYLLGPRINAGGRVGRADLGARLLSTDDPAEAAAIAERLDDLNKERRAVETAISDVAIDQARARPGPLAWAAGDGWHPGVVGIVASRLKEATNRPAVVIGLREDGIGQGSARSVTGVDIGSAIQRLAAEGLLEKGGGHRMAAGLTVRTEKLNAAMDRLAELIERQGGAPTGPDDLRLDGAIMAGGVTRELIAQLDAAGPFGQGAPAPRFAIPDLRVVRTRRVGDGHLQATFADGSARLDAFAFRVPPELFDLLEGATGHVHVAGKLELNRWQGRETVRLKLDDAAPA